MWTMPRLRQLHLWLAVFVVVFFEATFLPQTATVAVSILIAMQLQSLTIEMLSLVAYEEQSVFVAGELLAHRNSYFIFLARVLAVSEKKRTQKKDTLVSAACVVVFVIVGRFF